jgi:L-lactate dehydrogenase complex protein LldG
MSTFSIHDVKKVDTIVAGAGGRGAGAVTGDARAAGGDSRADILYRIRSALHDAAARDIPRDHRTEDARDRDEIVSLFAERVAEYRATVHRVRESEVGDPVARIASESGARRIGIPEDLPQKWRPADAAEPADAAAEQTRGATAGQADPLQLIEDAALSVQQLDALDGALTGCAVAIAEVGAFVLDAGPGQGRRALTLVPDLHICVVREDQIVGLVPEAIRRLEGAVGEGRPLTFVAGPSATSDIELDRVEGVHGPRVLHVVVAAR